MYEKKVKQIELDNQTSPNAQLTDQQNTFAAYKEKFLLEVKKHKNGVINRKMHKKGFCEYIDELEMFLNMEFVSKTHLLDTFYEKILPKECC